MPALARTDSADSYVETIMGAWEQDWNVNVPIHLTALYAPK